MVGSASQSTQTACLQAVRSEVAQKLCGEILF